MHAYQELDNPQYDPYYLGFIQGICWTVAAEGNQGLIFNEPNELVGTATDDIILFSRYQMLRNWADLEDEATTIYLKLLTGPTWMVFHTEVDGCPDLAELAEMGFASAHYLFSQIQNGG